MKMKQHTITQEYTMTVTIHVEVPDDWSDQDTVECFSVFPINATIKSLWEDTDCPEVNVGSVDLNSVELHGRPFIDAYFLSELGYVSEDAQ